MTPNPIPPSTHPAQRSLPTWAILVSFALLAAFLLLTALGLRRTQQGPITVGQTVPPIQLSLYAMDTGNGVSAAPFHTQDYRGKVLVLNFWASWCQPCEQEAQALEQAWQGYRPGGKVVFLGIDYVDTEPEARAYLKKYQITYPNGPDLGTRVSQAFRIRGVPETYIIGKDGKLAYVQIGPFASLRAIQSVIDPLLQ